MNLLAAIQAFAAGLTRADECNLILAEFLTLADPPPEGAVDSKICPRFRSYLHISRIRASGNSTASAYGYFVLSIANYVIAKPELFATTAIIVIFDEGGGYYDSGYKRWIFLEMEPPFRCW